MDTFDLQEKLFMIFRNDSELTTLLGVTNTTDDEQCNNKIRRTQQDPTLLTTDMIPFIDFVSIDAIPTKNYKVNKCLLEFNIYCAYRYDAMLIYKRINKILKENFEDMRIVAEGQISSPIQDIFCYRFRTRPLVNS